MYFSLLLIVSYRKFFSIVSFVLSALLTLLIMKQVQLHKSALNSDFHGVQKVHSHFVARIGRLSIFLAVGLVRQYRSGVCRVVSWMLSLLLGKKEAYADTP